MTSLERALRATTRARRRRILDMLRGEEPIEIHDLALSLEVSESTVRRDLLDLERSGEVVRTLGGALGKSFDPSWRQKERLDADAKRRIALQASELVAPNSLVFLDAGTTTAAVARTLATRSDLTLATYGLPSLVNAADGKAEVLVVGGRLHQRGGRFVGAWTYQLLGMLSPDIAFIGADAFDALRGINCPDAEIASLKTRIIEISEHSWVLLDRSKLVPRHRHQYWAPVPPSVGIVVEQPVAEDEEHAVDALHVAGHRVIVA